MSSPPLNVAADASRRPVQVSPVLIGVAVLLAIALAVVLAVVKH